VCCGWWGLFVELVARPATMSKSRHSYITFACHWHRYIDQIYVLRHCPTTFACTQKTQVAGDFSRTRYEYSTASCDFLSSLIIHAFRENTRLCNLPNATKANKCYPRRRLLALTIYFGKDFAIYKMWITPERDGGGRSGTG
jgi:hypothetical protein